ncbi:MAG: aldo/keto reductase [Phycisphaerae bacterium]|nr:aldo/keto reductase [Phycisphaerae bacterium]
MRTKQLGTTDLTFTVLGLGTWAMGGPWEVGWGPQDDNEAMDATVAAIDAGINWIDTAPIYGCGHSEDLVGQALKRMAHKPLIATKCGIRWDRHRCKIPCLRPDSVEKECHESLKRLGIETIDLYQMHRPEPAEDIEWAWETMAKLRDQGKVRYLGVSNCTIEQMDLLSHIARIDSAQPLYSMIHREIEPDLFDYCRERNMGILPYSSMGRGLLTGKFDHRRLTNLAEDDHRHRYPDFQEPRFSATLELVNQLKRMADHDKRTVAQLALAWTLRRPEITSTIVGARRPEQILETVQAGDYNLAPEQIEHIEHLLENRLTQIDQA